MGFFDKIIKALNAASDRSKQGTWLPDVVEIDWKSSNYRDPSDYPRRDPNRKLT